MWAITKKELEQRYWLTLVGLAFFGFLYFWTYREIEGWSLVTAPYKELPKDHNNFLNFIYPDRYIHLMFMVLYGAITGFSLFFTENQRNNWVFLRQRSISVSHILAGKILAGTILFLIPTLIFSLGQIYWFASPGKMAVPWTWEYLLVIYQPVIWGWTAMLCFLSVEQPGLKLWQRFIPPVATLVAFGSLYVPHIMILYTPTLWTPFLGGFWTGLFLIFHIWTQFKPADSRLSWNILTFAAVILPVSYLGSMLFLIVEPVTEDLFYLNDYYGFDTGIKPSFTEDGDAVLCIKKADQPLSIKPLYPANLNAIDPDSLISRQSKTMLWPDYSPNRPYIGVDHLHSVHELYYSCTENVPEHYFWLKKKELVVGYNSVTRQRTGFLGSNGWVQDEADATPFHGISNITFESKRKEQLYPVYWITTETETFLWDTSTHHLEVFMNFQANYFGYVNGSYYAIDTKTLWKYRIEDGKRFSLQLPRAMKRQSIFMLCESSQGVGLIRMPLDKSEYKETKEKGTFLAFINWSGEVKMEGYFSFPISGISEFEQKELMFHQAVYSYMKLPGWEIYNYYLMLPLAAHLPHLLREHSDWGSYWEQAVPYIQIIIKKNLILACVFISFIWIRRKLTMATLGHGLVISVLGFPWVLTLVVSHYIEGRVLCPHCKKKRATQGKRCEHCSQPWPEPSFLTELTD